VLARWNELPHQPSAITPTASAAQVGDTVKHGVVRLVVIAVEGRGVKECLVEVEEGG
jgi:hypothetical protein